MERNPVSLTRTALALAWCSEFQAAQPLIDELNRRYPVNTVVNGIWLPAIRAAIELKQGRPEAAIAALAPAIPYETAAEFWPQYLRGHAYLHLGKAREAQSEFRKILDHRGQDVLSLLYPLTRAAVAKAAELAGDSAAAGKSYSEFLADWKDADAGLPDLIAARRAVAGDFSKR